MKEDRQIEVINDNDYTIGKKVWDWLDIAREMGTDIYGKYDVNGKVHNAFIDPWFFCEILEIRLNTDGTSGLLVSFEDLHNFSNRVEIRGLSKILRIDVIRDVFIGGFGARILVEKGIEKYYFKGWDTRMFFEEWVRYVSKGTGNYESPSRYEQLDDNYFIKRGFDDKYYYDGVYDRVLGRVKFCIFIRHDGDISNGLSEKVRKIIKFFNGNNYLVDEVYMCSFEGNKEKFETMCKLIV